MKTSPSLDTLIVPGGRSLWINPRITTKISEFIKLCAAGTSRIASVCTGIYGLTPTGCWMAALLPALVLCEGSVKEIPRLRVNANALFLKDGERRCIS